MTPCWRMAGLGLLLACILCPAASFAQDETVADCPSLTLNAAVEAANATISGADAHAEIFQMAGSLLNLAARCGFQPDEEQLAAILASILQFVSVPELLASQRVGYDMEQILLNLADIPGNPLRGMRLYQGTTTTFIGSTLTCETCHNGLIGPTTEGTYTRVIEQRLPELPDYSATRYLVESLILPDAYTAPGYSNALMQANLGDLLDAQDLADLLAYMESQDQELAE